MSDGAEEALFHPFAATAAMRLTEQDDGTLSFLPDDWAEVERAFEQLLDDPDLRSAVESIVHLAAHLEEDRDSQRPARALLQLMMRAVPKLGAAKRVEETTRAK